jgi:uroporphyrin-III C-methyltransferase / precorrin-2 dehydrogenase / sirohydrochlorin ferrochelatase
MGDSGHVPGPGDPADPAAGVRLRGGSSTPPGPAPVYPLGIRLDGRRVVVVGGGTVALRRVAGLLAAGADVHLVAPDVTPALADLAAGGRLIWLDRRYADGDLESAWLAMACTDQPDVNASVAAEAERRRVFCGRVDDASAASAWVPATGRSGPFTVAVHADRDPTRAAALRDRLVEVVATSPPPAGRPGTGRVVLVGGGPGDPGLLTVRGRAALADADVVVADRLSPLAALDELPARVTIVDAAKVPGGRSMPQEEINALLVEHARAGRVVVRLKGGDPYVFGRGMEEVQACVEAGVPVEVVPGVTSAVSVPGAAGIPVTHRGVVQAFTVVSGHVAPDDPASTVDWAALAAVGGTLVVLMGVATMAAVAAALLAGGLPAGTPVAGLQDGHPARRSRLDEVAAGSLASVGSPAVFVIGEVAGELPGDTL